MSTCAIIPAYKPISSFPEIVRALSTKGFSRVVVVDDGSGPEFRSLFDEVARMPGCCVLRHSVNRGKGAALKTALHQVWEDGSSYGTVVTVDADGQHAVEDCLRVAERLEASKAELVLGVRDFSVRAVPFRSWWGNRWTSIFFAVLYGRWLYDTQTGLRAFRRALIPYLLQTPGEGYAYEMAALCGLVRAGVLLEQVPIRTLYEADNASSHYSPLKDSLRVLAMLVVSRFKKGKNVLH